jgi:hypothetical protein
MLDILKQIICNLRHPDDYMSVAEFCKLKEIDIISQDDFVRYRDECVEIKQYSPPHINSVQKVSAPCGSCGGGRVL